jgi:hypothetical protein
MTAPIPVLLLLPHLVLHVHWRLTRGFQRISENATRETARNGPKSRTSTTTIASAKRTTDETTRHSTSSRAQNSIGPDIRPLRIAMDRTPPLVKNGLSGGASSKQTKKSKSGKNAKHEKSPD